MINLDEKRETVTISAFPEYTWVDRRLTWDPEKFNQQHTINLPVEKIWQPSIILYSNTDGIYDPTVPVMVPVKRNAGESLFRFRIENIILSEFSRTAFLLWPSSLDAAWYIPHQMQDRRVLVSI